VEEKKQAGYIWHVVLLYHLLSFSRKSRCMRGSMNPSTRFPQGLSELSPSPGGGFIGGRDCVFSPSLASPLHRAASGVTPPTLELCFLLFPFSALSFLFPLNARASFLLRELVFLLGGETGCWTRGCWTRSWLREGTWFVPSSLLRDTHIW
jgi:hypothetical protein